MLNSFMSSPYFYFILGALVIEAARFTIKDCLDWYYESKEERAVERNRKENRRRIIREAMLETDTPLGPDAEWYPAGSRRC